MIGNSWPWQAAKPTGAKSKAKNSICPIVYCTEGSWPDEWTGQPYDGGSCSTTTRNVPRGLLSGKTGCDLVKRRPRPILGRPRRPADVNKAGDALVRCKTESVEHAAIVGVPFGDPVGAITERVRGEHEAHGGGTGGERLLPFRNFHVRCGAADHGDHQRRAQQTRPLGLDMVRFRVRIFGAKCGGDRRTGRSSRLAFEHDEAPRRELAVIGHPRGNRQQGVDFSRRRGGTGQLDRLEGAPRGEEI